MQSVDCSRQTTTGVSFVSGVRYDGFFANLNCARLTTRSTTHALSTLAPYVIVARHRSDATTPSFVSFGHGFNADLLVQVAHHTQTQQR